MMGPNEHQLILTLKSRFLDILDVEDGLLSYGNLLFEMLEAIREKADSKAAAFYSYHNCKKQLILELATGDHGYFSTVPSASFREDLGRIRKEGQGFIQRDFALSLDKGDLGYIVLKSPGNASMISESLAESLSIESVKFIAKAKYLARTILEEKRYKQLFRVTEKFHSTMNMDDVLGEIIDTLKEVFPSFTYYLLLSHDSRNLGGLPIKDLEYDSENLAAMQAYVTGSVQFEDSLQEKRSIMYAPLKGKQGVYGVLQVIAPNTITFPNNEIEYITLLAKTAGSALENAQLYQQSRRFIADLKLINETSHQLNSNLRLTDTTNYMTKQIVASFDAEEVGFILFSEEFQITTVLHGSTEFFFKKEAEKYIKFVKKKITENNESIFIGDFSPNNGLEYKYKSIIAVPMSQSGVLRGFAIVMGTEAYHFSFESFKLLQSLIHHSTLAFTNSMLREELEKMVITDHLTKLYSRSFLDERIHQSMNQDREGTFILIDIDDFKSVNDTFGHQVGDEVIIQVAKIIQGNIRGTDIGARWGGEELAIYLPGVSLSDGLFIADRIVNKVNENTDPHVTISCGVSHWKKGANVSYSVLFRSADHALYTAKQTGKNKVVVQEKVLSNR